MRLNTGATYEGDYKEDNLDGVGLYTWPDGDKYRGSFVKGVI
jgi:hypothetical protein